MLTGTISNPSTAMPGTARDVFLRGLEVGSTLIQARTDRGNLALQMCRLWVEHKIRYQEDLFPQERFNAYLAFIDRCIFPALKQMQGVFDGDIPAEALGDGTHDSAS